MERMLARIVVIQDNINDIAVIQNERVRVSSVYRSV